MEARTFDEIVEAYRHARAKHDITELIALKADLGAYDTLEARTLSKSIESAIYFNTGDYRSSLTTLFELLEMYTDQGNLKGVSGVTSEIGTTYWRLGDYGLALEFLLRGFAVQEEIGNHEGAAATLNNIGIIYQQTGDYGNALEYYYNALELHQRYGNRHHEANTIGNIGSVYSRLSDFNAALDFKQRALELQHELGDRAGESNNLGGIGSVYMAMKQFDDAENYTRRSLALSSESGLNYIHASYSVQLAELFISTQRLSEARLQLDEHSELYNQFTDVHTKALAVRARMCIEEHKYDDARNLLLQVLEEATARNDRGVVVTAYEYLRDVAKGQSDLESYIFYNEQYQNISSELRGAETTRRVAILEKEREIEAQRRIQERERSILYGALPQHIAERLIKGEEVADHYDEASVIFVDIVGFTTISSTLTSQQVTTLLDAVFGICDEVCQRNNIMKIKTIGDSYLAFTETANSDQRVAN